MPEPINSAASVYQHLPGGSALIEWFGHVPNFHDAEIVEVCLHRRATSVIRVHYWKSNIDEAGFTYLDKHVVVTFSLGGIVDLQLGGFSPQNVINGLAIRRARHRPDRGPYLIDPLPDDFEIELEDCFGLSGHIRCRCVRIALTPGEPTDVDT